MRKLLLSIAVLLVIVPATVMAGSTQEATTTDEGPIEVHVGLEEIVNAVWAEGEKGKEPVIRVLGHTPMAVADKVIKIGRSA